MCRNLPLWCQGRQSEDSQHLEILRMKLCVDNLTILLEPQNGGEGQLAPGPQSVREGAI